MKALARPRSFSLRDWYVHRRDADAIVYRPTLTALLKRLKYPTAAFVIGAGLLYLFGETRALFGNPVAVRNAVQAVLVVLGAISLVPVLSALIEELSIGRDARGSLIVRKRGVWSSTFLFPLSPDTMMSVCARESLGRTRRRGPLYSKGYTWMVTIAANPSIHAMEMACLDFDLDHQQVRPLENRPFPARVQEFVDAVGAICHIAANPMPTIVDAQRIGRGWGTSRRIQFPSMEISRHEVPLDELPQDVQAKVQSIIDTARAQGVSNIAHEVTLKQEFKVVGPDGSVQTYNSIDELPPDVRETIERMRHQRESR